MQNNYLLNSNIFIDYLKGLEYAKRFITENRTHVFYCDINEKELIPIGTKFKNKQKVKSFLADLNRISIKADKKVFDIYAGLLKKYDYLNDHKYDGLLASLAILKNLIFVTRNRKHFEPIKELKTRIFTEVKEEVK